jgi:hypothetical protein
MPRRRPRGQGFDSERGEDRPHRWQIRDIIAPIGEPDYPVPIDNERARHLEDVAARQSDVATHRRERGFQQHLRPHHLRDAAASQAEGGVCLPSRISEASKRNLVPSAEARRRARRPLRNRRNRRAAALEFRMGLAQRAQVLVAEGSAEVGAGKRGRAAARATPQRVSAPCPWHPAVSGPVPGRLSLSSPSRFPAHCFRFAQASCNA